MDEDARRIFDATPHRHPAGHVPDWDVQPEHLKDVFRRFAAAETAAASDQDRQMRSR